MGADVVTIDYKSLINKDWEREEVYRSLISGDWRSEVEKKHSLGNKIKTIRAFYSFSQKEFAEKLDITHEHILEIEKQNEFPSNSLFTLILNIFNIRDEWMSERYQPDSKHMIGNYDIFASNLRYLREQKDKTKHEMAKILSAHFTKCETPHIIQYDELESGRQFRENGLCQKVLSTITDYFEISYYDILNEYLRGENEQNTDELWADRTAKQGNLQEETILNIYRQCSAEDKKLMFEIVKKFRE